MNKSELVKIVHDNTNYNYNEIEELIDCLFYSISEALKTDDKVVISGFGTFEKYYQSSHKGLNPSTGEQIEIPGYYKLRFNASKTLKSSLNENIE